MIGVGGIDQVGVDEENAGCRQIVGVDPRE